MSLPRYIQQYKTGYRVVVRDGGGEALCREHFPFAYYDNHADALDDAVAFRDRIAAEHDIPIRVHGNTFHLKVRTDSTTGVTGLNIAPDNRDAPKYVAWCATYVQDEKIKHAYRSIRKNGYVGAYRLARTLRMSHTGVEIPLDPPPPPDWLRDWMEANNIPYDLTRPAKSKSKSKPKKEKPR